MLSHTLTMICFLLLFLLATAPAMGDRHQVGGGRRRHSKNEETMASVKRLQHWLEDHDALRQLFDLWGQQTSPLAAAFTAFNNTPSAVASGHDDPLLPVSVECLLDVRKLLTSSDLWALSMLDASVKTPVGLLAGVTRHLGNWEECVDQRGIPSTDNDRTFNGQMCSLRLVAEEVWEDEEFSSSSFAFPRSAIPKTNNPVIIDFLYYMQLSMGVCVPDSCYAEEVEIIFSRLLGQLKIVDGIRLRAEVYDGDCTTRDAPELDSDDDVAFIVLGVLAALVVVSTAYDAVIPVKKRWALLASFSVISNGRRLLELPKENADHTLSCLHGMRFLSMCWVVLCHRYPTPIIVPTVNPSFIQYVYEDFYHIFVMNGYISVDTFFVLSGLVLAYTFFKKDASRQCLNIPLYYLHRFIRITPALAMVVLLEATLLYHVGWGPLWEEVVGYDRYLCRKSWWKTILYVANYVKPYDQCVDQAWYLMVDMQLHWLSPLVLLPLARLPKLGLSWILLLSVGGTVSNFLIQHLHDLSGEADQSGYVEYSFANFMAFTHTRFVPYLIGLVAGYILAIRHRSSGEKKPLPFIVSVVGWCIGGSLMLAALLGFNMYLKSVPPTRLEESFYLSLERPTWALGLVLIVYLCAVGNGGPANTFLSWWGFHILGRLTYSMYLVHLSVQAVQRGSTKTQIYARDAEILEMFCGDIMISLVFGAALYLVCESPFIVIERELLGGVGRKKVDRSPANDPSSVLHSTPMPVASAPPANAVVAKDSEEEPSIAIPLAESFDAVYITNEEQPTEGSDINSSAAPLDESSPRLSLSSDNGQRASAVPASTVVASDSEMEPSIAVPIEETSEAQYITNEEQPTEDSEINPSAAPLAESSSTPSVSSDDGQRTSAAPASAVVASDSEKEPSIAVPIGETSEALYITNEEQLTEDSEIDPSAEPLGESSSTPSLPSADEQRKTADMV